MDTLTNITPSDYKMSAKYENIYVDIRKYLGEGAADYFYDACYVLENKNHFKSHTHIIAHLLREMEGYCRQVLLGDEGSVRCDANRLWTCVLVLFGKKQKNSHRESIEIIFDKYHILNKSKKDLWIKFISDESYKLHKYAHRNALRPARRMLRRVDVEKLFDVFCDLIEFIILIIRNNFFKIIEPLIENDDINKCSEGVRCIPHGSEVESFLFRYLIDNGIDRTDLLINRKHFEVWNISTDMIRSEYLVKFASRSPAQILSIILDKNICETKNVWLQSNIIEVATIVPIATSQLDELIVKIGAINDDFISGYSPTIKSYINLILHLADNGKHGAALDLSKKLFALHCEATKLSPKYDIYTYGEMLEKVAAKLTEAKCMEALKWMCDLLKDVVEADAYRKDQPEDNGFVMRPNIESSKYRMEELSDILIDAVITSSKEVIRGRVNVKDVCALLEGYNWDTFTRIMLYILMDTSDKRFLAEKLLDRKYSFKRGLYHEYYQLLKKHYADLDADQKDEIMNIIDNDEYLLDLKKRKIIKKDGRYKELTRERKYRHLSAIEGCLSGKAKNDFDALKKEFGDIVEDVEYGTPRNKVWCGPESPYDKEALKPLPVDQLITRLNDFKPPDDFMSASREGLGRLVSDVISEAPKKYAGEADKFVGLDQPIYIRNIFWGFHQALQKDKAFDWMPVTALLSAIVSKKDDPKHEPDEEEHHDDNLANWRTVKSSIASLVFGGLNAKKELELPADAADMVYSIIKELLSDPNPTVEENNQYSGRSYFDYAINTTRGKALECLIKYALWIRDGIENDKGEAFVLGNGFEASERMEAVRVDLEYVLGNEKTPTVMSVFGRWLPWLVLIDKEWCCNNKDNILPKDDGGSEKRMAVWQAYIKYDQPYNIVFEIFEDEYSYWVDNWSVIDNDPDDRSKNTFSLLQHLVQYYWRIKENVSEGYWFNLQGEGFTFEYVFKRVPPAAIAKLMSFIGRMLRNEKSEIPDTTKVRLKALWDYRFETTRKADTEYIDELNEFVDWFISDVFDADWSFGIMKIILSKVGYPKDDYRLYSYLLHEVDDHPVDVLEILEVIFKNPSDDRLRDRLSLHVKAVREIVVALHEVFKDGDDESRVSVLINRIGALGQGYYSFGEILGYDVK